MVDIIKKNNVEDVDIEYIHKKSRSEFIKLSGKKILITGAGGFLGFYFVKSVIAWNNKYPKKSIHVSALSSFRNGVPGWMNFFKNRKDLVIIKNNISKYSLSQDLVFDYIIHAASIASPTFYRLYPIETINANVQGLYKIVEYMVLRKKTQYPVRGLLVFSSSEIYGDPTDGNIPTPETYRGNVSCTGPRACYDESKRFCETLCVNYAQVHNLPIKVARPFNNYGPGMKITDGRVIADFSKNILENKNIVMFSDGSPSRTFCYVADSIIGYFKILVKGENGEAYNIGVEKPEMSMKKLAEKMVEIGRRNFGYKGKIVTQKSKDKNYLTDNPNRRCPVIDKAKRELGYDPEISLTEGLQKVLSWYKNTYYKD
ncbi:NAD-dependent epimerase/dehydratase family protein [Candidatus Parcubacteria bacterium]|nr:MAG: NAD-dependent epimerase/dehydratase family protein [Candidatus Parcubacteria bacterium]